eukprot:5165211-Amphidinium_carterae.1
MAEHLAKGLDIASKLGQTYAILELLRRAILQFHCFDTSWSNLFGSLLERMENTKDDLKWAFESLTCRG